MGEGEGQGVVRVIASPYSTKRSNSGESVEYEGYRLRVKVRVRVRLRVSLALQHEAK